MSFDLARHNADVIARRDMDPPDSEEEPDPVSPDQPETIYTFTDLCDFFGADYTLRSLNRRIYQDTACGASISVSDGDRTYYSSDELPESFVLTRFAIGSIVEGSDVEFDIQIAVPCPHSLLRENLADLEAEVDSAWHEANNVPFTPEEDFEAGLF